jgi:dTDP-4-amino-4,6-dideoxygalactose transaminase
VGDRERLLARINGLLDDRWLTNRGPLVLEFEQRLTELTGVKHCISMCNGTIALEIVIRALGLQGEVIVPSFTFIATAHALQWQEITPVFCDVDPVTYNIDPAKIEALITPRTTGIIGVHIWGRPCAVDALQALAERHELALLFDAAHAFGCSHQGRMIGGFGDAEVFSFHATKFFNSFEGGAVTTNDDALAEKIRLMQNFGFASMDNVIHLGINGKMTEVAAAMGLTGLESLDEFIDVNRRNYRHYRRELAGLPGVQLMSFDETERRNYQYIVLEIDAGEAGIERDHLLTILHAENVRARRYFYPGCHRMEPYRSYFPNAGMLLPETERLTGRTLSLPTGTSMDQDRIHRLCALLRFLIEHGGEISARLERPSG